MKTVLVDVEYTYYREYPIEINDDAYEKLLLGEGTADDDPEVDVVREALCRLRKETGVPKNSMADKVDYCILTADGEQIVGWVG